MNPIAPIRIFVGCASGDDAESQAVLEYTLHKHASQPLQIVWMQQTRDPESAFYVGPDGGWQTKRWSTPFSGFRWAIPELCGFEGEAIYMDSDMIVMDDIANLWSQKIDSGKLLLAKGQEPVRFCVLKWDCAAAQAILPRISEQRASPRMHKELMARFRASNFIQPFVGNWNCVDGESYASLSDPDVKLLHYSSENTQPHLRYAVERLSATGAKHWFDGEVKKHPRADLVQLFDVLLEEAKKHGYLPERYVPSTPFGKYRLKTHADYPGNRWVPDKAMTKLR